MIQQNNLQICLVFPSLEVSWVLIDHSFTSKETVFPNTEDHNFRNYTIYFWNKRCNVSALVLEKRMNTIWILVWTKGIWFGFFNLCRLLEIINVFASPQVSHHPMIVACHCEGTGWKFWGDSNLKSKFWGRSIQLDPVGTLTLEFDDGEVFQWSKVYIILFNCYDILLWF